MDAPANTEETVWDRINLVIDPALKGLAFDIAKRNKIEISDICRTAIIEFVRRNGHPDAVDTVPPRGRRRKIAA